MIDFEMITACGECCYGCAKKENGICPGCIESDGKVPEWAESGRCKIHACARKHKVQFCGMCPEFPCSELPKIIHWNPNIIEHLSQLREEYKNYSTVILKQQQITVGEIEQRNGFNGFFVVMVTISLWQMAC